jgi:hypothetical protein
LSLSVAVGSLLEVVAATGRQAREDQQAHPGPVAPRVTRTEKLSHHQSKIVRCGGHQVSLADVDELSEPRSLRAAGFAYMSEGPFQSFASKPLIFPPSAATHPLTIVDDGSLDLLGLPVTIQRSCPWVSFRRRIPMPIHLP